MWSSIRLFGAIRPTNRMFVRPSCEHPIRAPARAAPVAGGPDPAESAARPCAGSRARSSSRRLYSDAPTRQIDPAGQRRQLARGASAETRARPASIRREELRRRDVVVVQHARAGHRAERRAHRRGRREVQHRDVAVARLRFAPRPHLGRERASIVIANRSDSCPHARSRSRMRQGVIADRIAAVRRRHPLMDDHARCPTSRHAPLSVGRDRQRLERGRPRLANRLQFLGELELPPEVVGAPGRPAAPAPPAPARTYAEQSSPAKSCARSRASAASCAAQDPILQRTRRTRRRRSVPRLPADRPCRTDTPPPSIVAGTAVAARATTGTRL